MTTPESQNTVSALRENTVKVFREGHGSRPDVFLLEVDGEQFVLKDFDGCDRWFAVVLGRFLCSREARALAQLDGVSGVPRFRARVGARALTMESIQGSPVVSDDQSSNWSAFFDDFQRLIGAMHARGVAHCDLRSPGNTLIDHDNKPWLVDFTGSFRNRLLMGWVFRQLAWVDRSAIIKLKRRVAPACIGDEELAVEAEGHFLERPARKIGEGVRALTRQLLTRNSARK